MTPSQKRGAVVFFGEVGCVSCHAVSGISNEMFSNFTQHVAGIPQVAPSFGNVTFDGPGANEDFGLETCVARLVRCSRCWIGSTPPYAVRWC